VVDTVCREIAPWNSSAAKLDPAPETGDGRAGVGRFEDAIDIAFFEAFVAGRI